MLKNMRKIYLFFNLFIFLTTLFLSVGCHRPVRAALIEVPAPNIAPVYPPIPTAKRTLRKESSFSLVSKKDIIIIDPGHGGEDFGTHSLTKPKYQEKYLNLSTALLVKEYLEKMGYKPILTRATDVFITLENRAEIANKRNADLFVSVHYNSAPSSQADGIEVYYYQSDKNPKRSKASKKLAEVTLKYVLENTKAKSRGVKNGNFAVIRETEMPAILVEGGFLTNEQEMDKIKDPTYMKSLAWGIAQGIDEFLSSGSK